MEFWGVEMILGLLGSLVIAWALRALEWTWWKPRRLERALRAQGLQGNRYRFPVGDLVENERLNKEARAKPMPTHSHSIIPRVAPLLLRTISLYGKVSFTWLGPTSWVTLTDPELIREVLFTKFKHFVKPMPSDILALLATGLATYDGEKWARHRRIINPAFHIEKLKQMFPAVSTCCCDLISRWETLVSSEGLCELDVWPEIQKFTGDVISRTAFGSSYEEGRHIFKLQEEQAELLIQACQKLYIPGYRYLPTRNNLRMKAIDREVRAMLRRIIEKKENAMRKGNANAYDLLGMLLESNLNEERGSPKHGMSTEDVIEECKLFFFAGAETTSVLLTWTMVVLSMHPSWQARAREEVVGIFGNNKPDIDGLSRLKIVPMILNEVLRLYSPVVLFTRRTYKPMELGGITYPEGVELILPVIFVHHDPQYWGDNAHEFNPERFTGGVSKASNDHVAFFPFGWGPRICIGQSLAMIEAKMFLCMILLHFEFELSPSYSHAPYTVFTLHPQHGAPLILRKL